MGRGSGSKRPIIEQMHDEAELISFEALFLVVN